MTLPEMTALLPEDTIVSDAVSGVDNIVHKLWSNNINIGTVSVDNQGMINNVNIRGQYQQRFQDNQSLGNALAKEGLQITYTINF
ncbi:MAG: hypothetical protein ACYC97_05615 [Metallibacterium sp.]